MTDESNRNRKKELREWAALARRDPVLAVPMLFLWVFFEFYIGIARRFRK